jgi:signal peptidase I
MRHFFASILEIIEIAAIAVAAVFLIRTFLVQPFLVSGASMSPNFAHGDYLFVDQLTYRFRPPLRGEVAVFHYPNNDSTYFIKRIVGLPGERVHIGNGKVTVFNDENKKGLVLSEEYLPSGLTTSGNTETSLGENQYFVLGDNRSASSDSRRWGSLPSSFITGRAWLRAWPLNSIGFIASPVY